jgi:signal transduction histidine kinase
MGMTQPAYLPHPHHIAPGLLRVLRQAAALRFVLAILGLGTYLITRALGHGLDFELSWLPWLLAAQGGLFLAFVTWEGARRRLGQLYLPVALGWFLIMPIVEQALIYRNAPPAVFSRLGGGGAVGIGFEGLFVVIPVILATWQYGRRGLVGSLAVLLVGQLLLAPLMGLNPADLAFYLLGSLGRVAMMALLGYVVLQLVLALRREHQQLAEANRQLAQRAATAEQLAESRERNRLSRELHDTIAHSLTGLSVQLKALDTLMARDPAAAAGQLKDAQVTVKTGLQEARRAIQALRASPLEDLGLAEALRQLCGRMAERLGLAFECRIDEVGALDPLTEQAIYRVAEAALANVEQHAGAERVIVGLAQGGTDLVRLEVRDDGVGFDPGALPADRFGISGMRERAQLIGATLTIDARPGRGTTIALEARR